MDASPVPQKKRSHSEGEMNIGKTVVSYRNDSGEIVPEELATWVCTETFNDAGERVRVENVRREIPVERSEKELSEMKAMERFHAEAF